MNQYGIQLREQWELIDPAQASAVGEDYFANQGEMAQAQIEDLTLQLAGPDLPDETYLEKMGRINNARTRAVEMVMADLPRPVDRSEWEHRFEIWQGGHPVRVLIRDFQRTMDEIEDRILDEPEDLTIWRKDRYAKKAEMRADLEQLGLPLTLINQVLTPALGDADVVMPIWVTSSQTEQALRAWVRPQWEALSPQVREDAWDEATDGADYYQATQRVASGLPRF